jgi:hypothetical protein
MLSGPSPETVRAELADVVAKTLLRLPLAAPPQGMRMAARKLRKVARMIAASHLSHKHFVEVYFVNAANLQRFSPGSAR